jgi:hypothetical protein
MMYSKRAFVHWFVGEGMEEGEFSEAREYPTHTVMLFPGTDTRLGIWQHWRKTTKKLQNHRNLPLKRNTKLLTHSLPPTKSPFISF